MRNEYGFAGQLWQMIGNFQKNIQWTGDWNKIPTFSQNRVVFNTMDLWNKIPKHLDLYNKQDVVKYVVMLSKYLYTVKNSGLFLQFTQ